MHESKIAESLLPEVQEINPMDAMIILVAVNIILILFFGFLTIIQICKKQSTKDESTKININIGNVEIINVTDPRKVEIKNCTDNNSQGRMQQATIGCWFKVGQTTEWNGVWVSK